MATAADIGKWALTIDATPIEEILSLSGVGQSNNLLDVTNFDSGLTMEYIPGLADGAEISIEANRIDAAAGQAALIAGVKAKTTNAFILTYDSATTYTFNGVCLSYEIQPSQTEQNKLSFSVKISGDITEA